jgi:hypothetical protein
LGLISCTNIENCIIGEWEYLFDQDTIFPSKFVDGKFTFREDNSFHFFGNVLIDDEIVEKFVQGRYQKHSGFIQVMYDDDVDDIIFGVYQCEKEYLILGEENLVGSLVFKRIK